MERQAAIRRVRKGVSIAFALLAGVLLVLWVRSYWRVDVVSRSGGSLLVLSSINGNLRVYYEPVSRFPQVSNNWGMGSTTANARVPRSLYRNDRNSRSVFVPYWCPVVAAAVGASLPFAKARFSLRTMMVGLSLVALVLGLGTWLAR
jgi:hypothetical protein